MTTQTREYTATKIKQLVSLNDATINFQLNFEIRSPDNKPFYAIVLDQNTLDTQEKLEWQHVKGSLSGEIIADTNIFQNYFIAFKADAPTAITVTTQFQKLPDYVEKQRPQQVDNDDIQTKDYSKYYPTALMIVALIIGLVLLYQSQSTGKGKKSVPGVTGSQIHQSLLSKLKNLPVE